MKKKLLIISSVSGLTLPVIASAQTFRQFAEGLYYDFVPLLTNLFLTAAVLFFAWGVFLFMITEGDKKAVAKERLMWAAAALFIMISFWGLLRIVNATFFTNDLGKGSYTPGKIERSSEFSGGVIRPGIK